MAAARILIIDDEEKLRKLLVRIIGLEGYEVEEASDLESGRKRLSKSDFHLVLCDVKLPDGNGVDFVTEFKAQYPLVEIILLTAHGTIADGVRAMKAGAFDYLTKGDDNERIIPLVERASDKAKQAFQLKRLLDQKSAQHSFDNIIGESALLKKALQLSTRVAPKDTSVLLVGETGTGKEVFANAIHQASSRAGEHFVAVNCGAFSREILESEIFGHKAGAFTGAVKDKKGLFHEADGGTIFLDEIGEMDLDLQSKLLRVLENGRFLRVGDTTESKVDVRVIAATNRSLQEEANAGTFRLDLYYRLSTFTIELPPLRDRPEDIALLAEAFTAQLCAKLKRDVPHLSTGFISALKAHPWKGNVRELRNVIERALIINEGAELQAADLPFGGGELPPIESDSLLLRDVERRHIARVMQHCEGNKTEAAQLLGIGLTTLYRKLDEYQIAN